MEFDIITLMNRSNDYCEQGNYQKVIECCDKMLDYEPENIGASQDKGIALVKLKMYLESITYLNFVLKAHPDDLSLKKIRDYALSKAQKHK